MKYEDIKDFSQRCEEHPDHQTGMISERMIQDRLCEEIDELRAYIETKQEQGEPVACLHRLIDVTNPVVKSGYMCMDCGAVFRAYATPQQRTWVELTEEEKIKLWDRAEKRGAYQGVPSFIALIQEVEAKLKEKNT